MGGVSLGPNVKKESVRINTNGDVIDPRTKQIIEKKQSDYVPPVQVEVKPLEPTNFSTKGLSITEQIEQAEKHLADLKVKKLEEIARMKEELAKLENS